LKFNYGPSFRFVRFHTYRKYSYARQCKIVGLLRVAIGLGGILLRF
jgi:hypothetical protein